MKIYFLFLIVISSLVGCAQIKGNAWELHVVDNEGYGADGVRVLNKPDTTLLTVSWEQSGYSRCYVFDKTMTKKYVITVPSIGVEDAITTDLENDGLLEILTFQEKPANKIQLHRISGNLKNPKILSQTISDNLNQEWMYGEVYDFNNDGLKDFVAGSKNENGSVTLFLHPEKKDGKWEAIRLYNAGWIMSIKLLDMDFDGDTDILISDRRGKTSGVRWLANPGSNNLTEPWKDHSIGLINDHPFFLNVYRRDDKWVVLASEKDKGFYRIESSDGFIWDETKLFDIPKGCGKWVKDIALADIDDDGKEEIITAYNNAHKTHGIIYSKEKENKWKHYTISGLKGPKFDLLLFVDMDNDGDLDVLSTEENDNSSSEPGLGFVWYKNPLK